MGVVVVVVVVVPWYTTNLDSPYIGHYAHTHTHNRLMALCPGLPGWAGTRQVKPIWILLKQETVSGSGISWAVCKSAPRSRQITTPTPYHSVFYRPDAVPAAQPTASEHWRQLYWPFNRSNDSTQVLLPVFDHSIHGCIAAYVLSLADTVGWQRCYTSLQMQWQLMVVQSASLRSHAHFLSRPAPYLMLKLTR